MVPTHASFGLMLTAWSRPVRTMRAMRQDEYDRCLPTVTAVTCTRISRDSRGVSYESPLRAIRLASPRLGAMRLVPRGHEAFHDATPASVHSAASWACEECHLCRSRRRHPRTHSRPGACFHMTERGEFRLPTKIASTVPSVKRAGFDNPERLPSVRTLPMHSSLTCEVFRTRTERGKRPDLLSRDRAAEWRS